MSFLAAPGKFNAPGLTLPVAMEVGREEFDGWLAPEGTHRP